MKEIYLSQLCGYWYFFNVEQVQQVLPLAEASAPINRAGRIWLQTPDGKAAELCPLSLLFSWGAQQAAVHDHFLLVHHGERLLALPMQGSGRYGSAWMDAARPLPPAFPDLSRQMIPALLVNGGDVFMQINLEELVQAVDKIAYLRKKKQLLLRQAQGAKGGAHAD